MSLNKKPYSAKMFVIFGLSVLNKKRNSNQKRTQKYSDKILNKYGNSISMKSQFNRDRTRDKLILAQTIEITQSGEKSSEFAIVKISRCDL